MTGHMQVWTRLGRNRGVAKTWKAGSMNWQYGAFPQVCLFRAAAAPFPASGGQGNFLPWYRKPSPKTPSALLHVGQLRSNGPCLKFQFLKCFQPVRINEAVLHLLRWLPWAPVAMATVAPTASEGLKGGLLSGPACTIRAAGYSGSNVHTTVF